MEGGREKGGCRVVSAESQDCEYITFPRCGGWRLAGHVGRDALAFLKGKPVVTSEFEIDVFGFS